MFWYLKIIQEPIPKESDWNNSFQDLLSTARVFLENVPSVGIENPRFLLWNSLFQVLEPETPLKPLDLGIGEPCAPAPSKVAAETGQEKVQPVAKDVFV